MVYQCHNVVNLSGVGVYMHKHRNAFRTKGIINLQTLWNYMHKSRAQADATCLLHVYIQSLLHTLLEFVWTIVCSLSDITIDSKKHIVADNEWDKDWTSPSSQTKVSPNVPKPTSRSGSASSLRSGKAATSASDGPNGGGWAGWEQGQDASAATAGAGSKKDDADDWGKW